MGCNQICRISNKAFAGHRKLHAREMDKGYDYPIASSISQQLFSIDYWKCEKCA